MTVLG